MSEVDSVGELLFVSKEGIFRGYKECLVSDSVSQDLFCPECEGVLREPRVVEGRNFCETCSGQNAKLSSTQLTKAVNQLRCECPLHNRGCDWLGELSDLIGHMEECGYVMFVCPLGCGTVLVRNDAIGHIEFSCPQSLIECPFNSVGCKVKNLCRGNMLEHMESSMMTHQSLLLSAVVGMQEINLNYRDLILSHDKSIRQHDEVIKKNQENILQHGQTIYENTQTIEQHDKSITDQREFTRYEQTIKQLKIKGQNEKIENQNTQTVEIKKTIGNLINQMEFIRDVALNRLVEKMEWKINKFSGVKLHPKPLLGPKSQLSNFVLRGRMIHVPDTYKLRISVDRIEYAIYSDPEVFIIYWKLEIIHNSGENLVFKDQNGSGIPFVVGTSLFLAEVNLNVLIAKKFLKDDTLTMKFYFRFL